MNCSRGHLMALILFHVCWLVAVAAGSPIRDRKFRVDTGALDDSSAGAKHSVMISADGEIDVTDDAETGDILSDDETNDPDEEENNHVLQKDSVSVFSRVYDGEVYEEEKAEAGISEFLPKSEVNKARKPVMMLHYGKMGGTLMCALSRKIEKVVSPDANCNWRDRDFIKPGRHTHFPSCSDRRQLFKNNHFTWGQIERPFRTADYCPDDFIYFTMIRDPLSTAGSIINFLPSAIGHENLLQCVEARRQDCKMQKGWRWFDNFMVRRTLGPTVDALPIGEITHEHALEAIEVLKKFDAVTTLEGFKTNATQISLNNVLDWHMELKPPPKYFTTKKRHLFTHDQRERLRALIPHDYTLYNYFSQKA